MKKANINHSITEQNVQIYPDPFRFTNLILFSLVAITNSIPIQAFTGISSAVSQIYQVSVLEVSIPSIAYFIFYMILLLPANYVIDYKGLKYGTMISQICMCFGLTLRCLINVKFTYFIIGTFVCSFGFCLTISAAMKMPSVWFLGHEIFWVKSLLVMLILVSDVVGYFLSTFFINSQSSKEGVFTFFLIQSIFIGLFQILNIVFFRAKPCTPQNYASIHPKRSYSRVVASLASNTDYIFMLIAMTFLFSNINVLFVAISRFQIVFGIPQNQWKGGEFILIFSGMLAALVNGFLFVNRYRAKCLIFISVNFASHLLLWLSLQIGSLELIYISLVFIGVSVFPLLTTLVDYSAQVAFPVGEGTSGGSVFFGGHFFGALLTIFYSFYIGADINKTRARVTIIMFLVFVALGALFIYLTKEKLKRKQYEETVQIDKKISLITQNFQLYDPIL